MPIVNKEVGVEVILPDRNDTSSIITIKIPKHAEEKAEKIIREFCSFYELLPSLKSVVVGNQSVGSVLKGIGIGMLGVLAKPAGGAADFVSQVSQGIMYSAGMSVSPTPIRRRRHCGS